MHKRSTIAAVSLTEHSEALLCVIYSASLFLFIYLSQGARESRWYIYELLVCKMFPLV